MVGAREWGLGEAELGLSDGDAELGGGTLGTANVGVLLAVAVVPLDEEHAASPMASTINPVRAASFPILLLGALFTDSIRCVRDICRDAMRIRETSEEFKGFSS